jgi:acyl-CoA reductase-like NAD-dependent aldehyde dehydrogenase
MPSIEKALARAEKAQKSWKQVPVAERAAICRRMADWCVQRADELATELSWQMGRPVSADAGRAQARLPRARSVHVRHRRRSSCRYLSS